jgi:hypothetical protein
VTAVLRTLDAQCRALPGSVALVPPVVAKPAQVRQLAGEILPRAQALSTLLLSAQSRTAAARTLSRQLLPLLSSTFALRGELGPLMGNGRLLPGALLIDQLRMVDARARQAGLPACQLSGE